MVTIQNEKVCIPAPFLLGAIHREWDIAFDAAGVKRAIKLALDHHGKFIFTRKDTLKNVKPRYTHDILEEVRRLLSPLSNESLFENEAEKLQSIYMNRGNLYSAYRDAVAHILWERGFLPGINDITDTIFVEH